MTSLMIKRFSASPKGQLRFCIEAVKQNKYNDFIRDTFIELVSRNENCILGCAELPILFDKYRDFIDCKSIHIYDPLSITLTNARNEYLMLL